MSNINYKVTFSEKAENAKLSKCITCGKLTVFTECVKCLGVNNAYGKLPEEKKYNNNNIKSIMEIHKHLLLKKNSKDADYESLNNKFTWKLTEKNPKELNKLKSNWGIICNKKSGLMGVDIDYYKWSKSNVEKVKEFKQLFADPNNVQEFTQFFGTFTQQTPSGGLHLVFLYDPDLNQTASGKETIFGEGIDIRNGHSEELRSGGYLVGYGSTIKTKEGKIKEYVCLNNVAPKQIPENFKKWLLENIYTELQQKIKKEQKERTKVIAKKETEYLMNSYSYLGSNEFIENEIILKIPNLESFIYNAETWFKFTSAMKAVNKYELWVKYSKMYGKEKYNENKNNKTWNSIKLKDAKYNPNIYFEHLIGKKIINNYEIINYIKYKPVIPNVKKPNKILKNKKENAKLSNVVNLNLANINGGVVIQSDTATGKTTLMKKELLESNNNFISLVSRRTLAFEQHNVFNEYGVQCGLYGTPEAWQNENIVSQIDSFTNSCEKQIQNIEQYTIFLDEFNSILEYLFQADTCLKDRRAKVWKYLIKCLQGCKNFVCTDADISDLCFEFLNKINVNYEFIKNEFQHFKGKKAKEIYSLKKLIKNIENEIKTTGKAFICCDSKGSAEFIHNELKKKEIESKLLTSTTDQLCGSLDEYEVLIVSPVVIYGLDSIVPKKVFVFYKEHTISPTNMVQQIARVRNVTELEFCFAKKKFVQSKYLNLEDCRKQNAKKFKESKLEFDYLDEEEMQRQELFFELWVQYHYKQDCYNSNKYVHFKNLLVNRGWEVETQQKKTLKPTKEEAKYIKESIMEYKLENFNVSNEYVEEFNEKYLNFTKAQLLECKELFISDSATNEYFSMNAYFNKFIEYNLKKEELQENTEFNKMGMEITEENIKELYKMSNQYESINEKKDFKFKKIETQGYKYYIIDKLKLYSGCKEVKKNIGNQEVTNIIECTKTPTEEQQKEIVQKYMLAFEHRGKNPPKCNTVYECEKLIVNMLKKAISPKIFNKPIKTRVSEKTKYTYTINYECELFKLLRKINNYKKINRVAEELKHSIIQGGMVKPSLIKKEFECSFLD